MNLHAQVSDKDYIIGAEDVLEIQVWGQEDLHRTVEISKEGDFTFPLIGKVHATGLSIFELENLLKKRLTNGYLINPDISVIVTEYRSQEVFLFGEVEKPGAYILKGKTHLLEIISEAGGYTDSAGRIIKIVRLKLIKDRSGPLSLEEVDDNEIIILDIDQLTTGRKDDRFYVVGGDSIYVNKVLRIFVTGEVKKPGEYKWEKGLTVHQGIPESKDSSERRRDGS